ncbi:aminoacyl-tRNA hydrolase [Candidatus Parcubacteria bacterium]|nr:aminoacyl-tRNA hydrolase [Candidatus Parcubacteria bacterium]
MFLIAGLGNPGEKYMRTRHNIGFLILDEIAGDISWNKDKYAQADYWSGEFLSHTAILVKPHTFMNLSGKAIKELMDRDGIDMNRLVVVYDDIDLPVGTFKLSFDRGAGGHNGLKSIISELEEKAFLRIRVGIAPVDEEGKAIRPTDTSSYVLKEFSKTDLDKDLALAKDIKEAIKTFMEFGKEVAMNKYN